MATNRTLPIKRTAVTEFGLQHRGRLTALLGQAIDEFETRKASGRFDLPAAIVDEVEAAFEDKRGLAALKELLGMFPALPSEQPASGQAMAGLAGVFAGAAAMAARKLGAEPEPVSDMVDVTPERVQDGSQDSQAIDW
jgi:hypothetical protein